jgi:hypothetical protein
MALKTTQIIPDKLEIAKGFIEGSVLIDFTKELDDLWNDWPISGVAAGDMTRRLYVTSAERFCDYKEIIGPVLNGLVDLLEIPEESLFALNTYHPGGETNIHTDYKDRTVVINSIGRSILQVAPQAETPSEAVSKKLFRNLSIEEGDIVLMSGKILHRGINTGDITKRNIVFFFD